MNNLHLLEYDFYMQQNINSMAIFFLLFARNILCPPQSAAAGSNNRLRSALQHTGSCPLSGWFPRPFPGLTGLWQVEERGKGGNMSADERKQLDILYGQTYSFGLDMKIIFRTIFAFVQKENV